MLTDGRTDGQKVITIAHPEQSSGELISPTPWQPCFLTNHDCLYNLGRGSPEQHSSQVILKLVMGYVTRRILYADIYEK